MNPLAGLLGGEGPKLRDKRAKLAKRLEDARAEEARAVATETETRASFVLALEESPDTDPKRFRVDTEKAACATSAARAVVFATEDALARTDAALAPVEVEERDSRLRAALDSGETEAREATDGLRKILPKLADFMTAGLVADNRVAAAVQALSGRMDPSRAVFRFNPDAIAAECVNAYGRKLHPSDTFGGDGYAIRTAFPNLGETPILIPFDRGKCLAACFIENDTN